MARSAARPNARAARWVPATSAAAAEFAYQPLTIARYDPDPMNRIMLAALALTATAPAQAAERRYTVTDFDRIRVDGPFVVTLATGKSPSATASGGSRALERVAIDVEGRTLRISPNRPPWGGYPGEQRGPVEIVVTGHDLRAASVNGSGRLVIDEVEAMRFRSARQ